ncbi:Fe-S cluster assembly protein SufD [Pseudactinotalea sp. HY158]|uniref:Fe-S cluster assembly protein SufD n=1 Tax=Pseudactinotalea sp. HY158 TaxID=2654547 RepID=UPI00129CD1F2|nr:Fe-S cluster assembly protein SufD [Pseudactinotalea sp. HY158]QGH69098.1 Fe-S cluster assembly protein SufD [Pseudactinotalea sp. HY158]
MSTVTQQNLSTDHSRQQEDGAHSHVGGETASSTSRADRLSSFELADFALPTGREEEWRFSPVRALQGMFAAEFGGTAPEVEVTAADGVQVERVGADDPRLGRAGVPSDRIAAAAWEGRGEAWVVTVPKSHVATSETTVAVRGRGKGASVEHLTIIAEELSEATVVIDHTGTAELAQTVEIVLGDGAQLNVISVQDWDAGAVHASAQRAVVGRDARLHHMVITLGGDVVRLTPEASFSGPGGEVQLDGIYFSDAGQHQEHRLFVDHGVPNCLSRVAYKGALQGKDARSVWIGDVLIRKEAEGTDTYELNRNLVLTEGARADSVPNLEIETGEIEGAGHASATGRFDEEQLFYLRARGIPEDAARRLVVRGFFAEMIAKIGVASVEERILAAIEEELNTAMGRVADLSSELDDEIGRAIEEGLEK